MSEMVEHVARALIEAHGDHEAMPADDYLRMARAAIAAMREPTEAMIEAGFEACRGRKVTTPDKAKAVGADSYRAMISAALAESDPPHIIAAPNRLG